MDGRAKKKNVAARDEDCRVVEMQTRELPRLRVDMQTANFEKYELKKFQKQNGIAEVRGIAGKWDAYGMQIGLPGWRWGLPVGRWETLRIT